MKPIKVLIADNHQVVRQGLGAILEIEENIEVVGDAGDEEETVDKTKTLNPDVVLMDIRMSEVDGGIKATKEIKELNPKTKVLIFSSYHTTMEVVACMEVGVDGYLLKDTPSDEIVKSILILMNGGSVLHPKVSKRMMNQYQDSPGGRSRDAHFVLTGREQEILDLMAKGSKNKDIAQILFLAETTVKTHVGQILRKLDAADRTQALLNAIRRGIVSVEETD